MDLYKYMLGRECRLRRLVSEILHIDIDFDNLRFFNSKTNEVYVEYQCEVIELIEKIPFNDDFIDEVLFFGDGTIEFHLMNEQDAYRWEDFSDEIIDLVNDVLARTLHKVK